MPTLLTVKGIRFFFYSRENDEPPHVHFEKGKAFGKAWLDPVEVAYWTGFKTSEKRVILQTISAKRYQPIRFCSILNGMNTSIKNYNKFDALETLIFGHNLRIKDLDIHHGRDIMNIILNTGYVIRTNLSSYPSLKKASKVKVLNYKIIDDGTGIHWPSLDEDISLKGFLKDELFKVVKPSSDVSD